MTTYDTPETARYDGRDTAYVSERAGYRDVGGTIFLWLAWAVAFSFWAAAMSSFFGILTILGSSSLSLAVIAMILLGAAIAWGAARWSTRDQPMRPVTEASTAALYNRIERNGGDDMTSRSPDMRRPEERDSYRPA